MALLKENWVGKGGGKLKGFRNNHTYVSTKLKGKPLSCIGVNMVAENQTECHTQPPIHFYTYRHEFFCFDFFSTTS